MQEEVMLPDLAWHSYRALRLNPRIQYANETYAMNEYRHLETRELGHFRV